MAAEPSGCCSGRLQVCFNFGHLSGSHVTAAVNSLCRNVSKEALCIASWNTPLRVTGAPSKEALSKFKGNCFHGDCGTGRAAYVILHQRDVFLLTSSISQHAKCGQGRQALRIYEEMREGRLELSSHTFIAALKACRSLQDLGSAKKIHMDVIEHGLESSMNIGNVLVDVYGKCGSVENAVRVFEKMPCRTVVSWNAMIFGYVQMDKGDEALQLYARMQQEGVAPDDRTFVGALKACSSLAGRKVDGKCIKAHCLERIKAIHTDIIKSGSESAVYVGTMLLDVYVKCGSLVDAKCVFENMPHRNVVSWTAMILGYARMEEGEVALQLYARMQEQGVVPDARAFVGALKACSSLAAQESWNKGQVKKCCLQHVRAIHSDIVKTASEFNVFVGNMLVDVYAKCGSLMDARLVFERMPHRNVVSWNAMISGYAQLEEGEEALKMYAQMQQEGVAPNDRTFVNALQGCRSVAALEKGKEIHAQIAKTGLDATDIFVANSLIDMYGKCGSMHRAQQVFDVLSKKDLVSWSALIAGYARQGQSEIVFSLFERMNGVGILPEAVTFLSVLTVCSHVGAVDKGQKYFEAMSRDFGITPGLEHYTCMVDLLARAGDMEKAMVIATTMPFQPDGAVWQIVLGACRKWKNTEVGRQAFEHAVRLDKNDDAAYAMMSAIYAGAHKWEDAKQIQALRAKAGARKQPGQSWWPDTVGTVHAFEVEDREHPGLQHLYVQLQDMFVKMKDEGFVPNIESLSQEIPDAEDTMCGGSEMLAIAKALLKIPYQ